MMIQFNEVSKSYGDAVAVHPTTLQVAQGEVLAIIGPSGCGKSTLLRLVAGLIEPTTGEVLVGGQRMTPANATAIRRKMGYVIQDGGLFPHLTARENVTLMAQHLGRTGFDARLEEIRELVQFPADALDRYPLELSGGQRQRVALMRGLALEPTILLMDEPLGALDPIVRSTLQADLKSIFERLNSTVLLVTHDMGEAAFLGDRIVLMREGHVVQQGTLERFQNQPAEPYVTEFLNAQRSVVAI